MNQVDEIKYQVVKVLLKNYVEKYTEDVKEILQIFKCLIKFWTICQNYVKNRNLRDKI